MEYFTVPEANFIRLQKHVIIILYTCNSIKIYWPHFTSFGSLRTISQSIWLLGKSSIEMSIHNLPCKIDYMPYLRKLWWIFLICNHLITTDCIEVSTELYYIALYNRPVLPFQTWQYIFKLYIFIYFKQYSL